MWDREGERQEGSNQGGIQAIRAPPHQETVEPTPWLSQRAKETASSYSNLSVKVGAWPGLFISLHSDHGDMDKGPLETKKPALEQRGDADGIGVEPIGQAVVFVTHQQIQ